MVAVLAPRPLTTPDNTRPGVRRATPGGRPPLRVIEGGRSTRRSATPSRVLLRRRLMAVLVVLGLVVLVAAGIRLVSPLVVAPGLASGASPAASSAAAGADAALVPIAADTYVVRPGDTLWSIAERLDPGGDPRPVVDSLRSRAGGAALEAGQRIDISGLGS